MFEGLKKLWKEAKQKAEDTDDSVIRMNIACQNEHETMPVDLSPKLLLRKSALNTKVNLERIIAKINSLDVDERKEWEQLKVVSEEMKNQVDIIINHPSPPSFGPEMWLSYRDFTVPLRNGGCPPPSIGNEQGTPIDKEIAALVAEMNRVGIKTTCSCQGHDNGEAYVSIRLGEGTTYLHRKDIFGPGQDELTLKWRRK